MSMKYSSIPRVANKIILATKCVCEYLASRIYTVKKKKFGYENPKKMTAGFN